MPNLCVKSEFVLVEHNGSFGVPFNILHHSHENFTMPLMIHVKSLDVTSCVVGLYIDTREHIFLQLKKARSYSAVILLETCKEPKRQAPRDCACLILSWLKRYWGKKVYVKCLYAYLVSELYLSITQ